MGDQRRTKRLVEVAEALAQGCGGGGGGTITSVIRDRHQAKAAYRLLDKPQVTHDAVIGGHCQEVLAATTAPGEYLLIEDTTSVNYAGLEETTGLGPIGEDFTRGLWVHSTLVVKLECDKSQAELVGLLGQQVWARSRERPAGGGAGKGQGKERSGYARQLRKDRESRRWMASLQEAAGAACETLWIYVADRESDIYELFLKARAQGWSYVIRAAQPRALAGEWAGQDLFEAAAAGTVRGHIQVHLARQNRTAVLEVRSTTLELRGASRPGGRLENHVLNVVWAKEVDAPAGQDPVHWVLLTDLPVETLKQCQRVLAIYTRRWLVEEFHKALKTGLQVEASQLSSARRLGALIGILSVVAVFLLQNKLEARNDPEAPLDQKKINPAMTAVLRKLDPPQGRLTRGWFWIAIAKLGGFQARPSDGDPGWLTLWRGWQTLMLLVRGYELADSS